MAHTERYKSDCVLSDDYIGGRGFFTGAFVGLHCEDISGDGCYADFDYFSYEPVVG